MNFNLTEERQMLQDSLRRYLLDQYQGDKISHLAASDTGFCPDIWAGLSDMGVIGAMYAEQHGGYGGAGFDIAVVFEELGRAGAVDPLLDSAILGGGLLAACDAERYQGSIEKIVEGHMHMALAHAEPQSRYELSRVETTARRDGDYYVLNGQKAVVINAVAAESFIISARTSGDVDSCDGISLFLVEKKTTGLSLNEYALHTGERAAELYLENVKLDSSTLLGEAGQAFEKLELAHARATIAVCAEALGLMETIRDLTTEYLKVRKQFGKPIGKFQVLQHRMADMLIEIEQARSAVINLAGHIDAPREQREKHVSAAKNLIGLSSKLVGEESIQMHGGIAMTMEYELGHLVKRLLMVDHRFGDATHHLERFIELAVV